MVTLGWPHYRANYSPALAKCVRLWRSAIHRSAPGKTMQCGIGQYGIPASSIFRL
ncbi:Uncharacterised protein [Edwardsiella hoshinae]|uniref:Uncharacterized protein n=1 Tax=Edwardsiella hoshinae TaxID=93378 RepID=A0A376D6W1_9GAMM|nr:Uncharacterised protein [Edwardsiella hoshinae]